MREDGAKLIPIDTFSDSRGVLKKILMLSQLQQGRIEEVYLLLSHPGSVRGNHYHLHTQEFFAVVAGTASIALEDRAGKLERLCLSAADNLLVQVPPGVAHAFKNETDQPLVILAVSTREYNRDSTDTFPMEII